MNASSIRRTGKRGEPGAGRRRDRAARPLHGGPGVRVEPLDLAAAGGRRVVVAADADRADRRSGARPRRPAPGRSRRRRRDARPHRPLRSRPAPRRGRRGCCGCPRGPRCARRQSSSAPLTMAVACAPRDRAGSVAGAGPARRGDDEPVAVEPRHGRPRGPRRTRRRAPRSLVAAAASSSAEVAALPGDEDPAGGEQREGQLDELGERGDRPGGDGRPAAAMAPVGARASARTAAASTVPAEPGRRSPRPTGSAAFLAIGSTSRARARGQGGRERDARVAAARPEVEEPVDAAIAAGRDGASGCRRRGRAPTAAGSRIAVRLMAVVQASSSRAWPSIAARAPGRQRQRRAPRARRRGRRRTPAGAAGCPRRASGAARAVGPRHASCGSRAVPPRGAAPGVGIVSHRGLRFGLPRSVRFAAGSPRAPRGPRYPGVAPVRMPDGRGRGRGPRQRGFPRTSRRPPDSWITRRVHVRPSDPRRGPAARASAGPRR